MRRIASQPPRTSPCTARASWAYAEQDGWNRQCAPRSGDTKRRYTPMNLINPAGTTSLTLIPTHRWIWPAAEHPALAPRAPRAIAGSSPGGRRARRTPRPPPSSAPQRRSQPAQSSAGTPGRNARHATRIWRFARFRSTAVPTARATTRPNRACPSPSPCPHGAPPSRSHTCTTNPPAPRLRPSRSTRRKSRGAVSRSRDSRRCRSPRPTPRDVPALCAGDARSLPGPPVSASGSGIRGSSCGGVCLAEKFASRITSRFSRRDRPKPQVNVSASRLAFRPGYLL